MFVLNKLKHYITYADYIDKLTYAFVYRNPYGVPNCKYIINTLFSSSYIIYNRVQNEIKIYHNKGSKEWLIVITRHAKNKFNVSTYKFKRDLSGKALACSKKTLICSKNIKERCKKRIKNIYVKCKVVYEKKIREHKKAVVHPLFWFNNQ